MSDAAPVSCPRCGAAATGNFCAACGTMLGTPPCSACGTTLGAGAKFCHKCGAPVGGSAAPAAARVATPRSDRTPWIIAGVAVLAIIAAVAWSARNRGEPTVPAMANAGNAGNAAADAAGAGGGVTTPAPSIANLTPKERFLKLQTRIDQQLAQGDTTRLAFFMQMALDAYGLLDEGDRDINVRFHAAMLEAQAGMFPNARALADTILKKSPDNLLGYYVQATAAGFAGDSAAAKAARAAFRSHYAAEIRKSGHPEYIENGPFLAQYLKGDGAK